LLLGILVTIFFSQPKSAETSICNESVLFDDENVEETGVFTDERVFKIKDY